MAFPKKGMAQGLILGILISLLQTDLNNLYERYSPYPEVQDVLLGESAAMHIVDTRPTRFDYPTSPKHIDDSEIILNRLLQTSHIAGQSTNVSAYLVTGLDRSSSVEVTTPSTSHHYGSQFSAQQITNLSLEDQDIIQLIMQTDEEQTAKESSFHPTPLQHNQQQVQHTYNGTIVMTNTYQHNQINNNVVVEPILGHPVYTTQTSLEMELNELEENGMFNGAIVDTTFDNNHTIHDQYLPVQQAIRADPSLASTSGSSLDMSMWSDEPSSSKLSVDILQSSPEQASDNVDELLKRASTMTDWDIDLDFDLDIDDDDGLGLDIDYRRDSVSEDSAVGGSLSPKSWGTRSVSSHEEGAVGGYSYDDSDMDTSYYDEEFEYPSSRFVQHDHTYSAPYGGQPHVRKMDIKVTKEPSRGSAHDEIMCRKLKIPIPLEKIINSPVDEFNKLMKKHSLNSKQSTLVRDIRRRGKNKVAAQNCRTKKMTELSGLDTEISDLRQKRDELKSTNSQLLSKHEQLRADLERVTRQLSPHVKNEHGADFDPSQYAIEVDETGSLRAISLDSQNSSQRRSKRRRRQ